MDVQYLKRVMVLPQSYLNQLAQSIPFTHSKLWEIKSRSQSARLREGCEF